MKIYKMLTCALGIFCVLYSCLFGLKKISSDKEVVKSQTYEGILSVWQIDGFEGGKGSRRDFLMSVARDFEKEYKGVPVMVVSHTIESANNALSQGEKPDVISYSHGVNVNQVSQIKNSFKCLHGEINGKAYALPWCRGGYVLISKQNIDNKVAKVYDEIVISNDVYTQPFCALTLDDISAKNYLSKTPLNAYVDFVAKKDGVMLGTQRDLIRLQNRGIDVFVTPIKAFNDLYQYVSYFDKGEIKNIFSQKFINLLLSEKWQKRLTNIGMMSDYYEVEFDNENLNQMQKTKTKYAISCFYDKASLLSIKDVSIKAFTRDENSLNKLKKLIVLP